MARKRKYSDRELIEDKKFIAEVYVESETYDVREVIERIKWFWDEKAEWFYILHDKDIWTLDDVTDFKYKYKEDAPYKTGDEKKPHYHLIVKNPYSITLGNAATKFGIPSQFVQPCRSVKAQIQYLIHQNDPQKHQYFKEEIVTNVEEKRLNDYLKSDMSSTEKAMILFDYIDLGCNSIADLAQYALKNGCWDELRRGQHIYTALINERNNKK